MACHELVEGVVEWPAVSRVERLTMGAKEDRLLANLWLYGPAGWHRVGNSPPGAFSFCIDDLERQLRIGEEYLQKLTYLKKWTCKKVNRR